MAKDTALPFYQVPSKHYQFGGQFQNRRPDAQCQGASIPWPGKAQTSFSVIMGKESWSHSQMSTLLFREGTMLTEGVLAVFMSP